MDLIVFNHHSLPFNHQAKAEATIPDFLKICIEAKNRGLKTILVDKTMDASWFRIELANGYFWQDWYNQHKAGSHRDLLRAFRSIATQSPLFNPEDILKDVELFEVILNGASGLSAICAAAWYDAPLLSFDTGDPWNASRLKVNINRLNSTTSEIETEEAELVNLYSLSVLIQHLPEIIKERTAALSSGREIVQELEGNFPGIYLCGKALQQLNNWSAPHTTLEQVKQSLSALSEFSQKWKSGEFQFYNHDVLKELGLSFRVSGESPTVANNPKLRRQRLFFLPCGREEYFEQHIKITAGYRLHFFPDNNTRRVYIGYIGPHLRLN